MTNQRYGLTYKKAFNGPPKSDGLWVLMSLEGQCYQGAFGSDFLLIVSHNVGTLFGQKIFMSMYVIKQFCDPRFSI